MTPATSPTSETAAADGLRVAFLGPAGTFTEQALHHEADLSRATLVPCDSMVDVLFTVHEGDAELGVVPIENAIEGMVNATIDTLAFDVDVLIQRELVEPVTLNLLAPPGATLESVRSVVSIPVATAQCRTWLRAHLPDGRAPRRQLHRRGRADRGPRPPTRRSAAIGNTRAAEVYGLDLLATDIEDHPENRTRFVVVGRSGIPAPTGHDKSSIVVYQRADRPGSLLAILQEFAARSINLTLLLVPTHQDLPRRLLLRARARGPHRRRGGGRLPALAACHPGRREVPRLLPRGR